jgi:hypothetical protein
MKTAVLLATYNGAAFLRGQLDSLREQSAPPDVLIVRDDGSTDGTVELLHDYLAHDWPVPAIVTVNEQNLGWKFNFRELLRDFLASDAEAAFFCDQDDTWHREKIAAQLEVFSQDPAIELVSHDYLTRNTATGSEADSRLLFHFDGEDDEPFSSYPPADTSYSLRSGWTLALTRSLAADVIAHWGPAQHPAYDALLTTLACYTGTGANVNRRLGDHLIHGTNATKIASTSDTRQKNIADLQSDEDRYSIIAAVLEGRGADRAERARRRAAFFTGRLTVAKNGNVLTAALFVLGHWTQYASLKGRLRDIYFTLRK